MQTVLNERLNNNIYITFKETFSNSNFDSISEVASKVYSYHNEIAKSMQEINLKYGISLNYTMLEVSEALHWAETFQVLVRSKFQQEVQPKQTPTPNFTAPHHCR